MLKIDGDELKILSAYEKGQLKSVSTKTKLAKLKAAARATKQTRSTAAKKGRTPTNRPN
jgi:hypothetical protein